MITSLSNFFPEIQMMILEELPPACLLIMSLVNKHFANLALDNSLWKQHLHRDYPNHKYTIEWEHCFKEYSRLKKQVLEKLTPLQARFSVALEENSVEKIKEIFGKDLTVHKFSSLFEMRWVIKAQKNSEFYQFLSQIITSTQFSGVLGKSLNYRWNVIFEKIVPNEASSNLLAIDMGLQIEIDKFFDSHKKECLYHAAEEGQIEIFKSLSAKYPHLEYNMLQMAVSKGQSKFVEFYFKTYSPLLEGKDLLMLGHCAILNFHLSTLEILTPYIKDYIHLLFYSISEDPRLIDCMCHLIEKGVGVNTIIKSQVDESERTPLYLTVFFKVYPAAQFLLSKGANPNIDFPLDVALKYNDEKMIQLLREHGAQTST